jgi:cysteinyl-tRNA synthetase
MCLKHIGKTVDIHGGGTELVFPHHENEILQSEAYNDAPFVRYWMHNGLLTIDQEKMSKSLKNFFLVKDLLRKYSPEVIRFYLLNASYRQPLDYDERSLEDAGKALERLQNTYDLLRSATKNAGGSSDAKDLCDSTWKAFEERMDDDFSSREAIAVMYDFAREANRLANDASLSKKGAENIVDVFHRFNSLFDVLREGKHTEDLSDKLVQLLLDMRQEARKNKDFAAADKIRDRLAELGIEIQDKQDGAVWKQK